MANLSLFSKLNILAFALFSLLLSTAANANNTNSFVDTNSYSTDAGPIITTMTVPPVPVVKNKQFLALWPGYTHGSVLQPVLSWSKPDGWGISSWNCCSKKPYSSKKYPANVGDAIFGIIAPTCPVGQKACGRWKVTTVNLNNGQVSVLDNTELDISGNKNLTPAFFETQSFSECRELPANTEFTFSTIAYTASLEPLNPVWHGGVNANDGQGHAITPIDCAWTHEISPPIFRLGYSSGGTPTPSFDITLSENTIRVKAGDSHQAVITMTPRNGFKGAAILKTYGLPAGVQASFDNPSLDGSGLPCTLTLAAGADVKPGAYPIAAFGTSSTFSAAAPALLIIE